MPNPWVSLRRDQLSLVNKAVNEKEQLEKGLEEEKKSAANVVPKTGWFFLVKEQNRLGYEPLNGTRFLAKSFLPKMFEGHLYKFCSPDRQVMNDLYALS
jgi:hypothetical protein